MAATYRTRLVQVNQVVFDQVDIFQSDFFTRRTGLLPTDVTLTLFLNNAVVAWPLVDGSAVTDAQVVSGSVYWNELTNGAYGIRFYPNSLGHWSLSISYSAAAPNQIVSLDFDVSSPSSSSDSLRVDFC